MEPPKDLDCYFNDNAAILSDSALQSVDVRLASFKSCDLSLPTSFEESSALDSEMSVKHLAHETDSYLASTAQIDVENGTQYNVEANKAINDFGNMGKVFIAGSFGSSSNSVIEHTICNAPESSTLDEKSQRSENLDFGESVALEDFGGDFEDGSCTLDTIAQTTDIFAEETGGTSATAGSVLSLAEEGDLGSSIQARASTIDCNTDSSGLCETNESEVEQSVNIDKNVSNQVSSEMTVSTKGDSNKELNVNSRPRRSVARKSVFELLQVEYRGSGVSRKHIMEVDTFEDSSRKSNSSKKRKLAEVEKQCTSTAVTEMQIDLADSSSNAGDLPLTKILSYTPDDFSIGPSKDEVQEIAQERKKAKSEQPVKLKTNNVKKRLSTGIFAGKEVHQNSFASEFELASADVLSQCRASDEVLKADSDLIAENDQLRARLKALEESGSTVMKKFKIDVHSRKFSRIRSPPPITSLDRKALSKAEYLAGSESGKVSESLDAEEAWKSRSALLDRRENKVREISAELDERTSALRINEGALQRRERKLIELEKTLEYRERVLSRHEQNVQKRELELELNCSAETGAATADELSSSEHATLINEFKKRLDLRRQELDRRQNFLETEREKLVTREREVERREQELTLKLLDHANFQGTSSSEDNEDEDVAVEKISFTKTVSATKTKPSKKSLIKESKVSTNSDLTPSTVKKVKTSASTPQRTLRKGAEAHSATVSKSVNPAKKLEYKLRKRSV